MTRVVWKHRAFIDDWRGVQDAGKEGWELVNVVFYPNPDGVRQSPRDPGGETRYFMKRQELLS